MLPFQVFGRLFPGFVVPGAVPKYSVLKITDIFLAVVTGSPYDRIQVPLRVSEVRLGGDKINSDGLPVQPLQPDSDPYQGVVMIVDGKRGILVVPDV